MAFYVIERKIFNAPINMIESIYSFQSFIGIFNQAPNGVFRYYKSLPTSLSFLEHAEGCQTPLDQAVPFS